jgi:hypothetical protein
VSAGAAVEQVYERPDLAPGKAPHPLSGKVLRRRAGVFRPEGFTVLRVKVNGPQPFGLPVRAQAADIDCEVVERSPLGAVPVSWISEIATRSSA